MNRYKAKDIAQTVTNEQLYQMLLNAKNNIIDWSTISIINKSLTKGTAWNILAKDFKIESNYHILAKINMIREFGEYLPSELKPVKKSKQVSNIKIIHEEPNFSKFI